jgi:O-antigen/teichoic acid export membrane protein
VPFTASLNAHENMLWIAVVTTVESLLKLAIALSLVYFIQTERLFVYGLLMAGIAAVSFVLYAVFCLKKYNECSIRNYTIDRPLLKELTDFAGWNLFGALCWPIRQQGLAVLLNIFLGTVVNAAYGIANQIAGQIQFFSATMLRAVSPQIMKSEGASDRQRMLRLSMMASKFGFFLVAVIAIPCIFEMPIILKLWLKNVPEHTIVFCTLVVIMILTNQLTIGLQSSFPATGKIKIYQIVVGSIILLNLPLVYIILKMDLPASYAVASTVFIEFIACIFRLFLAKKQIGLSIKEYLNKVIVKEILPTLTLTVACWAVVHFLHSDYRIFITLTIPVLLFFVSVYFCGLCKDEKILFDNILIKKIKKLNDSIMR